MRHSTTLFIAVLLISACSPAATDEGANVGSENQQAATNDEVAPPPTAPATNDAVPATSKDAVPPAPGTVGGLPDDRTPLAEPKGPIDPKSAEAAGQVAQNYAALVESKRYSAAEALWNDPALARAATTEFRLNTENHFEIGKPGQTEGAAGSIYINVPIVFYGTASGGKTFSQRGHMVLRRVNDVPGSTANQRRWHIQQLVIPGV